jgi:hypothetical protein
MESVPCNRMPDSSIVSVTEARSVLVPGLVDGAAGVLRSQGCEVISGKGSENVIINYPPGSTRQKLTPSTSDARYRVKLPNGCELREVEEKGQTCMRLYMVRTGLEATKRIGR